MNAPLYGRKKVLIALPLAMLEEVDYISVHENRTRSDLVREALRRYITNFKVSAKATVMPITEAITLANQSDLFAAPAVKTVQ